MQTGRAGAVLAGLVLLMAGEASAVLQAVGPASPDHGFPFWYRDTQGTSLEPCLEADNPLCALVGVPNPTQPVSFPDNFPEEIFWWMGDATMTTAGGDADLILALEGTFNGGVPLAGDQISFGRVRIRVDGLVAGETYTVTHPYGVDTFVVEEAGVRAINFTEDIGIGGPGDFTGALGSRIGPFLAWDPQVAPLAPEGFLGDPGVPHPVVGSPHGTNFFRIEGPGVGAAGSPFLCTNPPADPVTDCIETNLFTIMGKVSTIAGVTAERVTYSREISGAGFLDVFATSTAGQTIQVEGAGFNTTQLTGDAQGRYFAHIAFADGLSATVNLTNTTDTPDTVITAAVTDLVVIDSAIYDVDTGLLTVQARSSDLFAPPTLTATGWGALTAGALSVSAPVPPPSVTVTSSAGGSVTAPVVVSGTGFTPVSVVAEAGLPQSVQQGQLVTLDGTGSTGDVTAYAWTQTGGPAVTLTGADTAVATFTAPNAAAVLTFLLTVQGPGGPSSDQVVVTVLGVTAPVANAGPDQTVPVGTLVTLDGSASTGASTFAWTQLSGPAVTLVGANTVSPSFALPNTTATLVFQLQVTGPGGSATDTVSIAPVLDNLTVGSSQFRTRRSEWRVSGTASVTAGNTVTVRIGSSLTGPVLGTAQVSPGGNWTLRLRNSAQLPDGAQTISLQSSAGGQLLAVPVQVRN